MCKCQTLKASNLFELLVYSSQFGRFTQWVDCFKILFGVSSNTIMEEHRKLEEMINLQFGEAKNFRMGDRNENNFLKVTWIDRLSSRNHRKMNTMTTNSKIIIIKVID